MEAEYEPFRTTNDAVVPFANATALAAAIVDSSQDAIIAKTLDGRILTWNAAAERIFGYAARDMVGTSILRLFPGERLQEELALLTRVREGRRVEQFQTQRLHRDGHLIDIEVTLSPIFGPGGRIVAASKIARDVTHEKHLHRQLNQAREDLQTLLDHSPVQISSWNPDYTNRFANRAYVEALGKTSEQVIGRHVSEVLGPELFAAAAPRIEAALGGRPQTFERRVKLPMGGTQNVLMEYVASPEKEGCRGLYTFATDVTAQREAEENTRRIAERLGLATSGAGIGTWEWNLADGSVTWDAQMFALYGRQLHEVPSFDLWLACVHPEDRTPASSRFMSAMEQDGTLDLEYRILTPLGDTRHLHATARVRRDANGKPLAMVGVNFDVTLRKQAEGLLLAAARRDRLTGLLNRSSFIEGLDTALQQVRAGRQSGFALYFLDFDRFKLINDTLGHEAGDELLRQIAERLEGTLASEPDSAHCGPRFSIARFGGDEFLVLDNGASNPADAEATAKRMLETLSPPYRLGGRHQHSSASIGYVVRDHGRDDSGEVLRQADIAMYEAKRLGRARAVAYDVSLDETQQRVAILQEGLRTAVADNALELVFQPIVDLASGAVVSAEALLRWRHPLLGDIAPDEFIPMAEDLGLIDVIGRWVRERACDALKDWQSSHPHTAPETVSVNVSPRELVNAEEFLNGLRALLSRTGLPADALVLELPEAGLAKAGPLLGDTLRRIRLIGIGVTLDTNGTGTTSLTYLRSHPFSAVKLHGILEDLPVLHALVGLVENLQMESIVDGVENTEQIAMLQSVGCRRGQGYALGIPKDAREFLAGVTRRHAPDNRRTAAA